jgi:hypothetical protein
MRFLPHFAAKEILGKQIGVHDVFCGAFKHHSGAAPIGRISQGVQ